MALSLQAKAVELGFRMRNLAVKTRFAILTAITLLWPYSMRTVRTVPDTEEERARARLLTYFIDNPERVFYSRQLEVMFEAQFFHWVTNRALRGLIAEGHVLMEERRLDIGSSIKLVWFRTYRFYKRSANEVFELVNRYTNSATDGTLGMQGEHLVLAAFARNRFLLEGEAVNDHGGVKWTESNHDLDFVFSRDGTGYGIEVKNTLGYMDVDEFVTKVRLSLHLGINPVFAVRALPKTWIEALVRAGGFALVMRYQFYPWTHKHIADEIRNSLHLPVDTPKRIELGTMQRLEDWISDPDKHRQPDSAKVERLLARIQEANKPS